MTSIYLFLEDHNCFLLCEYEDDDARVVVNNPSACLCSP